MLTLETVGTVNYGKYILADFTLCAKLVPKPAKATKNNIENAVSKYTIMVLSMSYRFIYDRRLDGNSHVMLRS